MRIMLCQSRGWRCEQQELPVARCSQVARIWVVPQLHDFNVPIHWLCLLLPSSLHLLSNSNAIRLRIASSADNPDGSAHQQ